MAARGPVKPDFGTRPSSEKDCLMEAWSDGYWSAIQA